MKSSIFWRLLNIILLTGIIKNIEDYPSLLYFSSYIAILLYSTKT